jgi:ribosomal protein S18 acetylase RimI-like enzyme
VQEHVSPNSRPEAIRLRAIRPEDEAFLYQVYASTRAEELAPLGWEEAQKEAFLRMQFRAQHCYYHDQFPLASYQVILRGECSIGRLYVDRRADKISILDIALLPEHRNAGLGSALLRGVLAEAAQAGKPVRIYVECFNPALRLYERLRFSRVGDTGVYFLLEWHPATAPG